MSQETVQQDSAMSRFLDKDETPQFRSLGELKEIFKSDTFTHDKIPHIRSPGNLKAIFRSTMVIRINLSEEKFIDFGIKRADPGSLLMVQPEIFHMLFEGQTEKIIKRLSQDTQAKQQLVLANVIEPGLDIELVQSLPDEVLEILYNAVAGGLQENQSLLSRIKELDADELYRVYQVARAFKTSPCERLAPGLECPITRCAIDLFVFKIGSDREAEDRESDIEVWRAKFPKSKLI